jgi:hypothetical protein
MEQAEISKTPTIFVASGFNSSSLTRGPGNAAMVDRDKPN